MLRAAGILFLLIAICACQQQPAPETSTAQTTTSTRAAETTQAPSATTTTRGEDGQSGCFTGEPALAGDGFLGRFDATDSDSQSLAGINWTDSGTCAAVTLSFRTAPGAPAVDPPSFRSEFLRHTGVVRIEFGPEVTDSALSDQTFDTTLLDAAYVVLDPFASTLTTDLHLAAGSIVRVRSASSPARIVIELEGDGRILGERPMFGDAIVLLQPASQAPPMVIEGYGRSGLDVSASFISSGRGLETTIALERSPTRWNLFEWTIREFQPGPVSIRVGDAPPIEFVSQ